MRAGLGVVAVVLIAMAFALSGATMIHTFDGMVADIRAVFAYVPPPPASRAGNGVESGSLEMITVYGPPTGAVRGIQLAIFAMLLGGVPAAILAMALARRSDARRGRWPPWCAQMFLTGFVFQLGSIIFASIFALMLAVAAIDMGSLMDSEFVLFESGFLTIIVCGVYALRAWRHLRASAAERDWIGPATARASSPR